MSVASKYDQPDQKKRAQPPPTPFSLKKEEKKKKVSYKASFLHDIPLNNK